MWKGFLGSLVTLLTSCGLSHGQPGIAHSTDVGHAFAGKDAFGISTGTAQEGGASSNPLTLETLPPNHVPLPTVLPAPLVPEAAVPEAPVSEPRGKTSVLEMLQNHLGGPGAAAKHQPRYWGNTEYLWWWTKNVSLPPLVTQGNPADAFPGAIGQPGTTVLFGGNQDYSHFNGARIQAGGWCHNGLGLEASGFWLENRVIRFGAASNADGSPPLYIPIFRGNLGREGSVVIGEPFDPLTELGGFNGNVNIASQSRLWGAEGNLLYNVGDNGCWRLILLAGVRHLDLRESLTLSAFIDDFIFDIQKNLQDSFGTSSQFYGGQLGAKIGVTWGKASLDIVGKVALGDTYQVVNIHGLDTVGGTGAAIPGTFTEGIFTQASNIGRHTANDFSVVPQVQLKLAYEILPRVRATLAYDFLYWNKVVRAGQQIDRNVDFTQSIGFSPGPTSPANSPRALLERSDFWAQGVALGLEFRY